MATPASSAWHRRRAGLTLGGGPGATPSTFAKPSPSAPPPSALRSASSAIQTPLSESLRIASPHSKSPTARLSHARDIQCATAGVGVPRLHSRLAKAAQATAIIAAGAALVPAVLLAALLSCDWPDAAGLGPTHPLLAYVQALVRAGALFAVLAGVVAFHAVTLSNFRTRRLALPPAILARFAVVYRSWHALRHLLTLQLIGAVQVPAFAILCHGVRISRPATTRVAPSLFDLEMCFIVGVFTGVCFSISWHLNEFNVLSLDENRVALATRVKKELATALEPASWILALASVLAMVVNLFVPRQHLGATSVEIAESAAVAVDLSGLRRWWICVEAVGLCVLCWWLSTTLVSTAITQPYDFVAESPEAWAAHARTMDGRRVQGAPPPMTPRIAQTATADKCEDASVLEPLLFALNAGDRTPCADPTGVLGILAMQNLLDIASADRGCLRVPIFADASGRVWREILAGCLAPLDRLSYRLWLQAHARKPRADLPSLYGSRGLESAALYQKRPSLGSGGDKAFARVPLGPTSAAIGGSLGLASVGAATGHSDDKADHDHVENDKDDGSALFADSVRVSQAATALSLLLAASRSEDTFGVAQRGLVDAVTGVLQCHAKVAALLRAPVVLTRAGAPPPMARGPFTGVRAERARAEAVRDALAAAMARIVDAFRDHLTGYARGLEPRWPAKFNPALHAFLAGT